MNTYANKRGQFKTNVPEDLRIFAPVALPEKMVQATIRLPKLVLETIEQQAELLGISTSALMREIIVSALAEQIKQKELRQHQQPPAAPPAQPVPTAPPAHRVAEQVDHQPTELDSMLTDELKPPMPSAQSPKPSSENSSQNVSESPIPDSVVTHESTAQNTPKKHWPSFRLVNFVLSKLDKR